MNTRKVLPIVGVISLLLLAGCSGINPLSEEKTQAEKINESMNDVDSAQTQVTTVYNMTIRGENATLINFRRQQVQSQYNFTTDKSVTIGAGEEIFANKNTQYQFESYYNNGTTYTRRATSLDDNNSEVEWQAQEGKMSLKNQFTTFSDEDFFENRTPKKTDNNQTLVYQIDLLNNSSDSLVQNHNISQMDAQRNLLDVYALEIYVNNSTNRLEEVRLYAYGELSNEELSEIQPEYEDREGDAVGRIEYALQIEFLEYNHGVAIDIPEDAKNAE